MTDQCKNIIKKAAITIGLIIVTIPLSVIAYLGLGVKIGSILHPSVHNELACVCDQGPIMAKIEAIVFSVFYLCTFMIGLYFIIRKLKFSKWEQMIALLILFVLNGAACFMLSEILYMSVTG